MNLAFFRNRTKWFAIIGLLAIVVTTGACRSKGMHGQRRRGGGGCDCPSIGH